MGRKAFARVTMSHLPEACHQTRHFQQVSWASRIEMTYHPGGHTELPKLPEISWWHYLMHKIPQASLFFTILKLQDKIKARLPQRLDYDSLIDFPKISGYFSDK